MKPANKLYMLLGLFSLLLLTGCFEGDKVAGGGSDTEVGGQILALSGQPSSQTKVTLIPKQYNPITDPPIPESHYSTTDENGRYTFFEVEPGFYNIEAFNETDSTRLLIQEVEVAGNPLSVREKALEKAGTLILSVDNNINSQGEGILYIPGTSYQFPVSSQPNSQGEVILSGLPAGLIPEVVFMPAGNFENQTSISVNKQVIPEDTTWAQTYVNWSFKKNIKFNTTVEGAAIAEDVYDIPIPIVLNNNNFNFSEAASDGADIRLAKSDGTPLAYELDNWDPVNSGAVIWVKMDTVYGNRGDQNIQLFWGMNNVISESNSFEVFDINEGYSSVWHLGESPNMNANGYLDASLNGAHGQGIRMNEDLQGQSLNRGPQEGVLGYGQFFADSLNQYIEVAPQLESIYDFATQMTLCAWVKISDFTSPSQAIITKGDLSWKLQRNAESSSLEFNTTNSQMETSAAIAPIDVNDGAWHFVVASYNGQAREIYIDGQLAISESYTDSLNNTGQAVEIGNNRGVAGRSFYGSLDEIQVLSVGKSASWVKLSYESQKPGSSLLEY